MTQSILIKSAVLFVITLFVCCNNSKDKINSKSSFPIKNQWILNIENGLGTYCRDIDLSKYGAGDYTTHEKLTLSKGGMGQYSYSDFEQSFEQNFKWVVIDSNKVNIHYLGNVEKEDREIKITYDIIDDNSNTGEGYYRCSN